ncbi:DUF4115 domain-containing protein [Neiella marina]|uniref:DUF4115 domain-containing protein n=1 Tax=Neiella holothuriorum TaxID=2870530 RepID=A0ABS7EF70_9GAMM|nr:RodZ domain-containing protein [Neiella holothuriorum]MBW8190865.1 DUF4115 domain-containing protein [Neiella holothuriorum]
MKDEIEPQVKAAPETAGKILSDARKQMQLSVEDVAARLNLRANVIIAIDEDDEASLPSATFVRGYLRAYARLVGLTEDQVLQAYKGEAVQANMQSFSNRTSTERSDSRVMWLTYVIVLVLVACLVAWWWQKQQQSQLATQLSESTSVPSTSEQVADALDELVQSQSKAAVEAPVSGPATMAQELSSDDSLDESAALSEAPLMDAPQPDADTSLADNAISNELESDDSSAPVVDATDDAMATSAEETSLQQAEQALATQQSPVQDELASVRLILSKDCWMRVEDATGQVVAEGVKTASRDVMFEGVPPFSAIFGVPDAVTIEYQGELYPFEVTNPLKTLRLTFPAG